MRPNPFLLGPLCLVLVAAILLITRVTTGQGTPVARPLSVSAPVAVAPTHRPAHPGQHAWREAGTRVTRFLDLTRRASARPAIAVQHDLSRFAHWTTGRAGGARVDIMRALNVARARASGAATALGRIGTRVQDGRRRAGPALGVSLRRAEAGIQDRARAIAGALRTAPWSH